jgi:outer membrane protein assembly factor BamA
MRKLPIYLFVFLFTSQLFCGTARIEKIIVNRINVFDSAKFKWEFVEKIANALHITTQEYLVIDELMFKIDDDINEDILYETERNLRNTGLFSNVDIQYKIEDDFNATVYVTTQDKWTTMPSLLVGFGGENKTYGGRFEETNLIGTGTLLSVEGLYRTENDIQWQGQFALQNTRLFRSDYGLYTQLFSNKYQTRQKIELSTKFRTTESKYCYGLSLYNAYGSQFLYKQIPTIELENNIMPYKERDMQLWFARAWKNIDRVFVTFYLDLQYADRFKDEFRRAFDNMGSFLVAFSSNAEDFVPLTKINNYQIEDVPVGGFGTAILGRVFPIGSNGGEDPMFYVAAMGERSFLSDDNSLYLFGQLSAGSGFSQAIGRYTYQEFQGLGFYKVYKDLLLTSRIRQQAVWNWGSAFRQLVLDNENGLRGYRLNELAGENRLITNVEFRYFPNIPFWIFNLGVNAFWDAGTVWKRSVALTNTQWHNAAGIGIRVYNEKVKGPNGLFRIDFVYNFDERKLAEIVFTTDQFFSAFGLHSFRLPSLFGSGIDTD